jgi:hypothetical protein
MERLVITAKDIQIVTGKSERYGRETIKKLKMILNKEQHQFITIEEFSNYAGFDMEKVIHAIKTRTEMRR